MTPGAVVTELCKNYGKVAALRGLSFTVPRGCIYGLIGPNGAGKTTTIAVMAGLLAPTSGRAAILGMEVMPNRRELVSRIGFASPRYPFLDYLTGAEVLLNCGLLPGLGAREAGARVRELLALMDLEGAAHHCLYEYSDGMRRKVSLACALIHDPEVLLLDEPFAGLDPTCVYRLSRVLRRQAERGGTVLLSPHDLALVERLVDRVGILHEGTIKKEVQAPGTGGHAGAGGTGSALESLLWEVVGTPDFKGLSWI